MRPPALDFLFSLERFGMKFGLANMAELCEALGHPERSFTSVIVGGTNGKGSVTAMVERALCAAGHRAARYTSPHLARVEERFVMDGREVATEVLAQTAARVQQVVEALVTNGTLERLPTFFECATAIAFELFRDARVEVAVLEVGLGGRLDATNIVTPAAAAIVSIDFDHQEQLGDTIASIAAEKAGIIKPAIPVVCGALPDEALGVVQRVCAEQHATLIRADRDTHVDARIDGDATVATLRSPSHTFRDLRLGLPGRHQAANAAVALRLLEVLDEAGIPVESDAIVEGLSHPAWPGRLERVVVRGCPVLLDAAHNTAGARALAEYLRETQPGGVTLVVAAMKDKAVAEMLAALAPFIRGAICTTAPTPRALDASTLAIIACDAGIPAEVVPDPFAAVERACASGRPVVVAGSIFLVGPVRERLARGILR